MNKKNKKQQEFSNARVLLILLKIITPIQCLLYGFSSYALDSSILVTGGVKLANDATTAALILEAGVIGFLEVKTLIAMQVAEIEEKTKHKKEAKSILLIGILVFCITAIVKIVLSYFGAKVA